MATEVTQLPHLKVFNRVLELPIIELALLKSAETYSRVKDSHQLVHWALTTAETSFNAATKQAIPIAIPIAKRLKRPINFVDHTLCYGLDKIEEKVPLIKKKPEQILEETTLSISHINDLIIEQAIHWRDINWNKINQLLDTHYGSMAVRGLNSSAVIIDKLIDKYYPTTEEEKLQDIKTQEEDKLLNTLQILGHLSNKASRCIYFNILNHLNINDSLLKIYINNLVEFLHFTKFLHLVNEKILHINIEKKKEQKEQKEEQKEQKEESEKEKKRIKCKMKHVIYINIVIFIFIIIVFYNSY